MDIYQIFTTHNSVWTTKEIIFALFIFVVSLIISLVLCWKKKIRVSQVLALMLLVFFLLIVFGSTVFGRIPGERSYELMPLWSYAAIIRGDSGILQEVLLNCVLLFPAGILLPLVFDRPFKWYQGLLVGVMISSCIEILQLITCRGLFEFDDIIHNSLGCMIGSVLSSQILKFLIRKIR